MADERIAYFLFKPNFFSEGIRGRTSHAIGFVNGLVSSKKDVHLYSGSYEKIFYKDLQNTFMVSKHRIYFFIDFCRVFLKKDLKEVY